MSAVGARYPEHEKMSAIREESQAIGEFLDGSEYVLAEFRDGELVAVSRSITQILADHFEIDLVKIEAEKRAMLDALRGATS